MNILRGISNLLKFNRTNWKAVALCFLAALVFWLFNALNKEYATNISFPLHFEFDHDRYVAVAIPRQVRLNVSGNGWDLLRKSLGVKLPALSIPLERPTEVKKIVGSTLPAVLAAQVGALQINHVVNDTLFVQVDPKDSHNFRLVADLSSVTYRQGFGRISPIVILPDSVELEGPRSLLHTLPDSIILTLSKNKLDENLREELEVKIDHDELVKRNPPVVEIRFEVGEVEELPWKLKLEIRHKSSAIRIDRLMDSVSCRVLVPRNHGPEILSHLPNARAIIDLANVQRGDYALVPKGEGLSPIVQILHMDSVNLKLY